MKYLDHPRGVAPSTSKALETVKWELAGSIDAEAERRRCATILDRIAGRV
ncbi:hypothetical protein [Methylobacterium sp. CM6257]